jgi:hypothetical protein
LLDGNVCLKKYKDREEKSEAEIDPFVLVVSLIVLSAECAERDDIPIVIVRSEQPEENITVTVVTYNEENITYYGRIKEVVYNPNAKDVVKFQDNLTVPCKGVMGYDWQADRMHTVTIDEWRFIDDVRIENS